MNKRTLFLSLLTLLALNVHAQSRQDIFNPEVPVTWLGLDFTRAKIYGDRDRLPGESEVVKLITSMNELMIKEADKYDVARALKRKSAEADLTVTDEHNLTLDINDMFAPENAAETELTPSDVQAIVSDYDFKGKTGLGVMINYGALNKKTEQCEVYFTVVNMGNREVLLTERYVMRPGGATVRNYWARIVVDMLEKIRQKDFESWKKKYGYQN